MKNTKMFRQELSYQGLCWQNAVWWNKLLSNFKINILKTRPHHNQHLLCGAYLCPQVHKPHSPKFNSIREQLFITLQCTIFSSSVFVVNAQYVSARKRNIATTKNQSINTMYCAFNPEPLWPSQARISIYLKIIFSTPSFRVVLSVLQNSCDFISGRLIWVL